MIGMGVLDPSALAGSFHHMGRSGELITAIMEYILEMGGHLHRYTDNMASGDNLDHRDR